jgi:hypothetical protein
MHTAFGEEREQLQDLGVDGKRWAGHVARMGEKGV